MTIKTTTKTPLTNNNTTSEIPSIQVRHSNLNKLDYKASETHNSNFEILNDTAIQISTIKITSKWLF